MNIILLSRRYSSYVSDYVARVTAAGGIVQDEDCVYDFYASADRAGQLNASAMRRHYHAACGVLLNDLGGGDIRLQKYFDLNPFTQVDAVQGTSGNQPAYTVDGDVAYNVPVYDGTNDYFSVNDLSIYNNQGAGTVYAVAKDTNRTGGHTVHRVVAIMTATDVGRIMLDTRNGTTVTQIYTRREDAEAFVNISGSASDAFQFIAGLADWTGGQAKLVQNTTTSGPAAYAGSGNTDATDSTSFTIGGATSAAANFPGTITSAHCFRALLSTAQLEIMRQFEKRWNGALP